MTSRLLTVEQVQAIVEPHQPYTTERYRQECRACGGPVPCQTQRLADHIAAQAEQIDRQAAEHADALKAKDLAWADEYMKQSDAMLDRQVSLGVEIENLTEQLDRQSMVAAYESNRMTGDKYHVLRIALGGPLTPTSQGVSEWLAAIDREYDDMMRHGVEVAQRRQA